MTRIKDVVCGTDFSEESRQAGRAAAAWAACVGARLHMTHVIDVLGAEEDFAGGDAASYAAERGMLEREAEAIGSEFHVSVERVLVAGAPEVRLVETAHATQSGLIVVSSLGRRKPHRWLLGSVAERVAGLASSASVLVVRDSAPLIAWASQRRALKVVAGVDNSAPSRALIQWLGAMRTCGPCDVQFTRIISPAQEYERLGFAPPVSPTGLQPNVERLLRRELRRWVGSLPGEGALSWCLPVGSDRVEADLAHEAERAAADLLAVGATRRTETPRRWQTSVSRGALQLSQRNALIVPAGPGASAAIATFHRVLACTDFTDAANRAIPVAYGLVETGGVVHLLHVVEDEERANDARTSARLRALVPAEAEARRIVTVVEVWPSDSVHDGILQVAARRGVDAICLATHGRAALSQAILGSNAQEVVRRAQQPVVLLPPAVV